MASMNTPNWAARIWTHDGWIYLDLPSGPRLSRHTLRLPATTAGLSQALSLIKERHADSKLGEPGDPTQYQIEKAKAPPYDGDRVRRVGAPAYPSAQLMQLA